MSEESTIRLNKFIADSGIAARRKADELIESGRVTLNNNLVVSLGTKIDPEMDTVRVDGEIIKHKVKQKTQFIYVILNKPAGYVTTTSDEKNRPTVMDLVGVNKRIYPVGRLDYDSEGLLLLTNDGELANNLMHPKFGVYKTYHVKINKAIDERSLKRLREGVRIGTGKERNQITETARVSIVPNTEGKQLRISIHEGRNRQVRKMLESVGCYVRKLKRVEYANLNIKGLREGQWRFLNSEEIRKLKFAGKIKIKPAAKKEKYIFDRTKRIN